MDYDAIFNIKHRSVGMMSQRQVFSVEDFGAVGDDNTLNTKAIQAAIDACAAEGGGTVLFPKGVFVSGTLQMRGGITYRFERGAVLKGSGDMADYWDNGFVHREMGQTISLLWARDEENIRLTGDGIIDLSARKFFEGSTMVPVGHGVDEKMTEKQIAESVLIIPPRPTQPVFFDSCRHVVIDGITLLDSPCWTITLSRCDHIQIHHITVRNSLVIPNSDGVHISGCKDAIVSDCIFECGDDCVAVTCITCPGYSSERIIISRCHMCSRSAAVRVGHLDAQVRHVVISDLVVTDSNRGLAIFSGDDGCVEDVLVHNISMETRVVAGVWWGKGEAAVICAANSTGMIRDVTLSQIRAHSEAGILMAGTAGNVRDILIQDIDLSIKTGENYALFGGDLDFRPNLFVEGGAESGQGVYAADVENLVTERVRIR